MMDVSQEVSNLARVGLRTLVIAYKTLTENEYQAFHDKYTTAKAMIKNREVQVQAVVDTLEKELLLLGLTGVEDKLQEDVNHTLNVHSFQLRSSITPQCTVLIVVTAVLIVITQSEYANLDVNRR
jgi:hypothetical protein